MNYIRSRFCELAEHLKTKLKTMQIAPENFQAEISQMVVASGGHNETTEGWHLTDLHYRGVFLVERMPQQSAIMLILHCRAWLDDNDDTRDRYRLPDPDAALVPLDASGLVDLILTVDFVDPVFLAEAENGEIAWNGRRFAPVDFDLWIAERGRVNGAPAEPET